MLNNLSFLNIVMQTCFKILHLVQVYKDMPTHRKVFSGEKNLPYCQVHFYIPNINIIIITMKVVNSVVVGGTLVANGKNPSLLEDAISSNSSQNPVCEYSLLPAICC